LEQRRARARNHPPRQARASVYAAQLLAGPRRRPGRAAARAHRPTAYARDAARGVDAGWLRALYAFAPRPDLTVLLRLSSAEAAARLLAGGRRIKFYEAGGDLGLSPDRARSLQLFLDRLVEEYDAISDEDDTMHVLDAEQPVPEVQRQLRALVAPLLDAAVLRPPAEPLAAVLAQYGLRGRHVIDIAGGEHDA
jgi:hypothetical protein